MPRPHQVSLVVNRRLPPLSCLRVTYPDPAPPRWQTALCLSPLHSNYSNWQQVIETMELVKILGADHVTAYVTSVSGNVRRVLQHYVTRTFMHVHMWRNPPQPVHYYGQIAAINDCLFRMRHASKLVVFTDLDEVIVPHVHGTWSAMLDSLRQRTNDSDHIAVFTFRNAFFYLSPPGPASNKTLIGHTDQVSTLLTAEQEEQARWLGLSSARRLYRTLYIWGDRDRSKMIVDPLRVAMVGIHYPHFLAKGYRAVIVHPNLALLHHYRQWSPQKTVRDISALRGNVRRVLQHYVTRTFMHVHMWRNPPQPVHYYGQIAAINDCLFRMRHVSKLVVFADLDEVIVPHVHARRLYRTLYIWEDRDRSKMILDPLRVAMVGIHYPHILAKGYRTVTVHPNLALLHHYRQWSPQKTNLRQF
nr:hypothetical protein BaRGS_014821 [Batillaria attramentaria]